MGDAGFRCGFVAVVGRPNVGKSTLINALMGQKVSIVTAKPQTTRHRILAVHTSDAAQIVFVDTPGLHRDAGKAMNRLMNRTAAGALADADLVLFVSEANKWTDEDADVLDRIGRSATPAIALLNKVDKAHPKDVILSALSTMSERHEFVELIPVSAAKGDNLDALIDTLPGYLPESPPMFPEEMRTDRSREFHVAELIREKLTLMLHQELPYGLTVQIERFVEEDGKLLAYPYGFDADD
ncbi:MAG: GTPase Era, partial [Woeseiaceae bacterium]